MIEEQVQWKDMDPEQLREYHNRKNREYRARRKLLELMKTKKPRGYETRTKKREGLRDRGH